MFLLLCIAQFSWAQNQLKQAEQPNLSITDQDEMKIYVMVFLKRGPKRDHPKEEAAKIQDGHMMHLNQMHKEGHLLMAGPFMDDQEIRGILVMNNADINAVKDIVENDPAIRSGRLIAEYHLWYTKSGTITLP